MCRVVGVDDQVEYLCHIRGKFRGRRKSQNIITPNVFVLVGKRSWQLEQKKECDLLCILQRVYGEIPGNDGENNNNGVEIVFTNKVDEVEVMDTNKNRVLDIPSSDDEVDFDDI